MSEQYGGSGSALEKDTDRGNVYRFDRFPDSVVIEGFDELVFRVVNRVRGVASRVSDSDLIAVIVVFIVRREYLIG